MLSDLISNKTHLPGPWILDLSQKFELYPVWLVYCWLLDVQTLRQYQSNQLLLLLHYDNQDNLTTKEPYLLRLVGCESYHPYSSFIGLEFCVD